MFEYEYTGDVLHTLAPSAQITELAPGDLLSAEEHSAAGGVTRTALFFGGKAFATLAGTATLASGVAMGGNLAAPALGQVAQSVQAAEAADLIPAGGSVTKTGAILDSKGTVVGKIPIATSDPVGNVLAAALHHAISSMSPSLAPGSVTASQTPSATPTVSVISPTPTASPSTSSGALTNPAPSPSQPPAQPVLALPVLDFGTTTTATTAASGHAGTAAGAHGAAGAAAGISAGTTSTATTAASSNAGSTTASGNSGRVASGSSAASGRKAGTTSNATQASGPSANTGSSSGSGQRATGEGAKHFAEQQREQAKHAAEQSGEHEGGDD